MFIFEADLHVLQITRMFYSFVKITEFYVIYFNILYSVQHNADITLIELKPLVIPLSLFYMTKTSISW